VEERKKQSTHLKTLMSLNFLPVVTSFIESSAMTMGLEQVEALSLTLASEEIFSCLCRITSSEDLLSISCSQGGYCVKVGFSIPTADFNMRAFNLTTTLSFDEESDLEEMGLLIASRSVDHFHIIEETGSIRLILVKEKKYPEAETDVEIQARPLKNFSIRPPNGEEIKIFSRLTASYYKNQIIPMDLKYPGKLADKVNSGEYQGLLALDHGGHIGGGILWHWTGSKTIECLGPYHFNQCQELPIANALMEACLKAIAKSGALGIINRLPTKDPILEHFELLGDLTFFTKDGQSHTLPAYFRQLEEDPGLVVWSHPDLVDWLKGEYQRLVFPRDIQTVTDAGETIPRWSVLSTEFDQFNKMATLRPIRFGSDAKDNVAAHLGLLQKESFPRILFELDLGISWQTRFVPALIDSGFRPRIVLPYAGTGDLVVFQWEERY
jgi:hypothetical protein